MVKNIAALVYCDANYDKEQLSMSLHLFVYIRSTKFLNDP